MGNVSTINPDIIWACLAAYGIWNLITFLTMGLDKWKAKRGSWRISEGTLLLMAFFMGGVGSMLGAHVFRHKTQKIKFKILLPLSLIVNLLMVIGICYLAKQYLLG